MTMTPMRTAEHTGMLDAPPQVAYGLVADVTRWPLLFPPCLAARVLERDADSERIRLWAAVGNEVRSWISLRKFDEDAFRVDFRQETPSPPVTWMSGHWQCEPAADGSGRTRLVLGHEWATEGTERESDRIAAALEDNSRREIGAVKSWAERPGKPEDLSFSFTDRIAVSSGPKEVYDFLFRADLWPDRLPHVAEVRLETAEETAASAGAHVQHLEMDTRAADGTTHGTRSVRLCFPYERIVYKQTTVPRGLLAHSGEWVITPLPEGTHVTARHWVALDPAVAEEEFGPDGGLARAREHVRRTLGGNSVRTLEAAREFLAAAGRQREAR